MCNDKLILAYKEIIESSKKYVFMDKEFGRIYREVRDISLLGDLKSYSLHKLVLNCLNIPGICVEIGVYKGGSAKIIAETIKNGKELFLFDTFEGLPDVTELDGHVKGDFGDTTFENVCKYLKEYSVKIYKGLFEDNCSILGNEKIAFAHIDVDLYESTKFILEFLYDRMEKGGIILCDDYGNDNCIGVKKACDEFFKDKVEKPVYLLLSQCFVIKR